MRSNRHVTTIKGGVGQNGNKLSIIIVAGSYYPRLKQNGPRGLTLVSEQYNLINYQIDSLSKTFVNCEIILVVGYEADLLIKHKNVLCRIVENSNFSDTSEVEYLRVGLNNCTTRNVLVVMDDVFFKPDEISSITKGGTSVLVDLNSDKTNNDIGVELINDQVISFTYSSIHKWLHLAFVSNGELDVLQKFCNNKENKRLFIYEGLEEIIKSGRKLQPFYSKGKVQKL